MDDKKTAYGCLLKPLIVWDAAAIFFLIYGIALFKEYNFFIIALTVIPLIITARILWCYIKGKNEEDQGKAENNKVMEIIGKYVCGLPIAENADCKIIFGSDALEISSAGADFTLKYEKIYDIVLQTDTEIQKQYVSSAGAAVAGGVLFGAAGALIGGRIREKSYVQKKYYIIIAYDKSGNIGNIAVEVVYSPLKARQYIDRIKNNGVFAVKTAKAEL